MTNWYDHFIEVSYMFWSREDSKGLSIGKQKSRKWQEDLLQFQSIEMLKL